MFIHLKNNLRSSSRGSRLWEAYGYFRSLHSATAREKNEEPGEAGSCSADTVFGDVRDSFAVDLDHDRPVGDNPDFVSGKGFTDIMMIKVRTLEESGERHECVDDAGIEHYEHRYVMITVQSVLIRSRHHAAAVISALHGR